MRKNRAARLPGKVAVAIGSSQGVAKVFAAEGARVLVVARDEQAGYAVVDEVAGVGGEAAFWRADVSRWPDAEALAQAAVERFDRLDS